ncbi:ABC transporter permease [Actinophytocola sp.]|uniref:ABC transporter permease n=1 Tax=Actinophytocola sp. TaxID=1872138 RepID=UPI002D7F731D|nr:ABC transporter permease [Actinophytocola sp.]HET9138659.1 ABC transporter permease [Actinophytocola sp.]
MALSGRFRSALVIGGQGIRARKLRTLLSMLSLFLGVLAVVTVQAGLEIANRALLADVELNRGKDGTTILYVPPSAQTVPVVLETVRDVPGAVAVIQASAVIGEPGVSPLYCELDGSCQPGGGGRGFEGPKSLDGAQPPPGQAIAVQLNGLSGDIRQFRPFQADAGQWLDFSGPPSLSPSIVLNRSAAKAFTQNRVPAELQINSGAQHPTPRFTGVVHDAGYGPFAYVRADELLNWLPASELANQNGPGVMVLLAPSARGVEQTLRARLTGQGVSADQFFTETVNSREHYVDQLNLLRLIFFGMAGLVLLIGVAGILNVGLATVGERVEEFALRRAVGMPRLLLAGIVLAETLIIGLLTALAAIGVGIVGLNLASEVLGSREAMLRDVTFPWQAGVAGVIAGLAAGVLGGLIPAIRAARIPIATVMRA